MTLRFLEQHWPALLPPLIIGVVTVLIGWIVRNAIFRILHQWATRAKSNVDQLVVQGLRGPIMIWVVMLGLHVATQASRLPARIQAEVSQALLVLFVISMTWALSRLSGVLIRFHAGGASYTSLTENLARIVVVLLGIVIVLDTLGISVLPILTALGVGGIAIALALQDTLSNLFGGFYVSITGQLRIGDYVKLDSGEAGFIVDVSWRSTSIRSLDNNVIIIPNAKLAKATVTNYDLPSRSLSVSIAVGVGYDSDIDKVERVLLEVTNAAVGHVPGLLGDPAPSVRLINFGGSALELTLSCSVQKFADQYLVQHELRKRILKRFREETIDIPFPTRTVHVQPEAERFYKTLTKPT